MAGFIKPLTGYSQNAYTKNTILEEAKEIPVKGFYDVIVCGGGPAGFAAAVSAARNGARVQLIELQGQLGGIWTGVTAIPPLRVSRFRGKRSMC